MRAIEDDIPEQEKGIKKDLDYSIEAATIDEAKGIFRMGKERLQNINNWDVYAGKPSATFRVVNAKGETIDRPAQKGDNIRIDIPGPGHAMQRYDWVRVDKIESISGTSGQRETFLIQLRPITDPQSKDTAATHFFDKDASSTIILKLKGRRVAINYYGRNEVPNIAASNILDKARNLFVGIGAVLGFSDIQWAELIKGIIDPDQT